jgi:hypothetical protein
MWYKWLDDEPLIMFIATSCFLYFFLLLCSSGVWQKGCPFLYQWVTLLQMSLEAFQYPMLTAFVVNQYPLAKDPRELAYL